VRRTRHLYARAAKRQEAEEALKHSQRSSLGQLTGGVAHDFNNLLTVIRASVDLLRRPDLPDRAAALHRCDLGHGHACSTTDGPNCWRSHAARHSNRNCSTSAKNVQCWSEMIGTLIGSRIEIATHGPGEPCFVMPMPVSSKPR